MLNKRHFIVGGTASLIPGLAWASEVVNVSYRLYKNIVPQLEILIDGKGPYPFLISTGAAQSVIDGDLARALNLKPVGQVRDLLLGKNKDVSVGKVTKSVEYQADEILVGQAFRRTGFIFSSSEPDAEDSLSHEVKTFRGVLGADFITAQASVFDPSAMQWRFYPNGTPDLTGFTRIPSKTYRGTFAAHYVSINLKAQLGDDLHLECVVDTGGSAELYLTSKFVRKHKLWDRYGEFILDPIDSKDPSKGVNRIVRVKNFRLGDVHFDEINVRMADPGQPDKLNEADIDAVISGGLLKQFVVAFAGENAVNKAAIYLKPLSTFQSVSPPFVPLPTDAEQ